MARESSLDKAIKATALRFGAYHRKNSGNEYVRDIPDHTIIYKGRHISLEAKQFNNEATPGQLRELCKIQAAGGIAEVCYSALLLIRIFQAIENNDPWQNGDYKTPRPNDEE